jgi:hypothetical protein
MEQIVKPSRVWPLIKLSLPLDHIHKSKAQMPNTQMHKPSNQKPMNEGKHKWSNMQGDAPLSKPISSSVTT